jgi:hypothetical protein
MHGWKSFSLDEVAVVLLLLGTAALFGLIKFLRETALLRGFSSVAHDIRTLCKLVHGEKTRDGKDLVIRGRYAGNPVLIRFSRTENVPELNIQMRAEVRCNLFVAPARAHVTEGAARVQVSHPLLNVRCSIRTDHLLEARALLQTRQITDELWNLSCSSQAFVSIANGNLEFSEAQLPRPDTIGWIKRHLRSMSIIAAAAQGKPAPREEIPSSIWAQAPIWVAIGSTAVMVVGLFTFVNAKTAKARAATTAVAPAPFVSDIPAEDAPQIPDAASWRLAQPSDFDRRALDWAAQQRVEVTNTIQGKFTSSDSEDVAYVLVDPKTSNRRVVILVNGSLRFDANLPELALVARVPAGNVSNIEWRVKPTSASEGDGLLVLRRYDDPASSILIYCSGLRTLTAVPQDYHRVGLQ